MFVTKKNRLAVYSYLFKEGTCVAKKDYSILGAHSEELPVSNIEVLALLKSLSSRGYVKETFNWRWFYYCLTPEGVTYLREYLAIPEEVVPATLKKTQKSPISDSFGGKGKGVGAPGGFRPDFGGRRDGYRAGGRE